jgi:hypothetical protein
MKKSVLLLGIAPIVAVGLATLSAGCNKADNARASATKPTAPTRITREFELAGGSVETVSFTAPGRPGTLSGKWRASGKSGNDALSGFTLTDPSDAVLDSAFKGSSGSFQVKVSAAGKHTFFFENAGRKQTPRHVTLDAEFTPDE